MSEELVIQTNGPYLRVVLPDFEPDWRGVVERRGLRARGRDPAS